MSTVDIGIATFRRPNLLAELLKSLSVIELPKGGALRIIVADNDPNASAELVVARIQDTFPFPILFVTVKERGISYARNAILRESEAEYLAFLDDDEVVSPDWLCLMTECLAHHRADVVFGPVLGLLPENAPRWASKHPAFMRPRKITGSHVVSGGSGNVLFNRPRIEQAGLDFDPAFALSGGGDTDFFYRSFLAGLSMVWCDEAVASEVVPPERLKLSWVLRRGFRGGQCYERVFMRNQPKSARMVRAVSKSVQILFITPILLLLAFILPSTASRMATRAAGWLGQVIAVVRPGWWYREYESAHYRPIVRSKR